MKFREVYESLVRKKVIRAGKFKIILTSSIPGFKIVSGREKMMTPKERLKRKISQRRASNKRRAKKSQSSQRRKLSMKKRYW